MAKQFGFRIGDKHRAAAFSLIRGYGFADGMMRRR
jgi:hypothetical protein